MKQIYYTPGLRVLKLEDMIKMEFANLRLHTAITCYQILSTTILSNLKTYITTTLNIKLEMSSFKRFLALKQGKKRYMILVWRNGKVFRKNNVNVLL